jgi:hypothetical protein
LGESDEKVIGEMRPPMAAGKSRALGFLDLHLWEEKTAAAKFVPFAPQSWATAIESPVPKREDEHVREPEFAAGEQER